MASALTSNVINLLIKDAFPARNDMNYFFHSALHTIAGDPDRVGRVVRLSSIQPISSNSRKRGFNVFGLMPNSCSNSSRVRPSFNRIMSRMRARTVPIFGATRCAVAIDVGAVPGIADGVAGSSRGGVLPCVVYQCWMQW